MIFTIPKADNILQHAITSEAQADKEATADINAICSVIRNLLFIVWSSVSSEDTSFLRLSVADAAELVQEHAGPAKESLPSLDKFSMVSVIPLDGTKNTSMESRTPSSLGSMVEHHQ